ncbi:resistin [Ochotona princeps]|uniref:resistin n=1 Tax=Ochotona princeps TaxID=9978 RepID=UPI002714AEBE|nr:resistin [Ochotona princeps]
MGLRVLILSCRMKVLDFLLLLFLPVLARLVCGSNLCPVDDAINERLQSVASSLLHGSGVRLDLDCRTVKSGGNLATCPPGFGVTGCACGFGCGSWDVRSEKTCHCQCAGMDWTAARCCRLKSTPKTTP